MPDLGRALKTEDKVRRGGLPAMTADVPKITVGEGRSCDGCAETIQSTEQSYEVVVRGVLLLRFHHECYYAWVHFDPRRRPPAR
jgi:hypothetical protein